MARDRDDFTDRELEAFFTAARDETAPPSPQLLSRVLADAYALQETTAVTVPRPAPVRRPAWRHIVDAIGGWPAVAGLATAAAVGIWIGYNPPNSVEGLTSQVFDGGYDLTMGSSLPDIDFLLADG
ncbi:hypothetical protein [Tropicimonas isoalkanivorans]|uniref:Dihydroorotate dehydrogenase n=1 Tax=Tropicimonas isoalkanivorans TaxID=441112 RepID=A0A1I1LL51_9RHOB|nr:hypothetical protein [Tropicimonas isoalkanivorans]SFC70190.1 hypothetical protein SAMN04488094_10830 [Tropicimonas isoalkanivorans]